MIPNNTAKKLEKIWVIVVLVLVVALIGCAVYFGIKAVNKADPDAEKTEPTIRWEWADDFSAVTAEFLSGDEVGSAIVTEKAKVESVHKGATCESDESVIYTATVEYNGKVYTDTKTEEVFATALGHRYVFAGWTWEGNSKATAKYVCQRDGNHVEEIAGKITSERTEPTCTEEGKVVYTAESNYNGLKIKDQKTEILPAGGGLVFGTRI